MTTVVKIEKFNTQQAADYLDLKPVTLSSWRSKGSSTLKYKKIGRRVFYLQTDLDDFIESCTKTHT